LEEWLSFLKTGEIPDGFTAPGLPEARERLRVERMTDDEKRRYYSHVESLVYQRSALSTSYIYGKDDGRKEGRAEGRAEGLAEGRAEGKAEGILQTARKMKAEGVDIDIISKVTGLSKTEIAVL
jgi:predicted transposase/invertase (TIGR01784 family)